MRPRFLPEAIRSSAKDAFVLCLLAPACGGDSEPDRFSSDYNAAIERLDKASVVSMGFPHDFMALDPVKSIVFGGMRDRIKA